MCDIMKGGDRPRILWAMLGWKMNGGTTNLMEVSGMKRRTCFPLLLAGLFLLIVSLSLVACAAPKISTHISTEPQQLSFAAKAGDNALSKPLEIHSSATDEPLTWEAEDDALWLKLSPSQGTFDSGLSKAVVWVDTSGMSAGYHSATISIFVPEADNSPLTLSVELYLEEAEDPAVAAAREFWESTTYKRYWGTNAPSDVRDTVKSYEFPPPGETKSRSQEVEIKNIEFKYDPAIHERPIAIVHCIITWERTYPDPTGRYDVIHETWTGDVDVVLQVQPAPYHIDHNEWEVIDYYLHESE
jgi:hypothetical protein